MREVPNKWVNLIAHRGNLRGPNPERENSLDYLYEAIDAGFHIEFDLQHDGEDFYLGHDGPQYKISGTNLRDLVGNAGPLTYFCYVHCKTVNALYEYTRAHAYRDAHAFFHDIDDCILIKYFQMWIHPRKAMTMKPEEIKQFMVGVVPNLGSEINPLTIENYREKWSKFNFICTDYPVLLKEMNDRN